MAATLEVIQEMLNLLQSAKLPQIRNDILQMDIFNPVFNTYLSQPEQQTGDAYSKIEFPMCITFKTLPPLSSATIKLNLPANTTVGNTLTMLRKSLNIPADYKIVLVLKGKTLSSADQQLSKANVTDGATIHVSGKKMEPPSESKLAGTYADRIWSSMSSQLIKRAKWSDESLLIIRDELYKSIESTKFE